MLQSLIHPEVIFLMPSKETEKASEGYSAKIPWLYLGVPYPSEDLTSQFPTAD